MQENSSERAPATTGSLNASAIRVTGDDRIAFLQGQLTADVGTPSIDTAALAGWCDPKGRLLMLCHVVHEADAVLLVTATSIVEQVLRRLRMFVLRSRVRIEIDARGVVGLTAGSTLPSGTYRLATDPGRALLLASSENTVTPSPLSQTDWLLADIRAGIPSIDAATTGEFVPQMVNLELLGGVSFTKGCYVGQEIVARTRYLGRVKRRMLRFAAPTPPPAPGSPIHGGRGVVGKVVTAAATSGGCELLAVIPLDDLGGSLTLPPPDSQPLQRLSLPYAIPELVSH